MHPRRPQPALPPLARLAAASLAALALAGCATAGWSADPAARWHEARAPGAHARLAPVPVGYAPVPWWGRTAPSVQLFVGLLAPHGRWIRHPGYGLVFVPAVGPDWRPFTRGHWVEHPRWGRMWRSHEPFGWATAHYGRWGFDSRIGWFWVPDTAFGPHWVQWRGGSFAIGWAALPPLGWDTWGVGHSPWAWSNRWVFAPIGRIYDPHLPRHLLPPHRRWWEATRPIEAPPALAAERARRAGPERPAVATSPGLAGSIPPPTLPGALLPEEAGGPAEAGVLPGIGAALGAGTRIEPPARSQAMRPDPEARDAAPARWHPRREAWGEPTERPRPAARAAARAGWRDAPAAAEAAGAAAQEAAGAPVWGDASPARVRPPSAAIMPAPGRRAPAAIADAPPAARAMDAPIGSTAAGLPGARPMPWPRAERPMPSLRLERASGSPAGDTGTLTSEP